MTEEKVVLRPIMAGSAYKELVMGSTIEIQNENVFNFLRYLEKHEDGNINLTCKVNELNKGWTLVVKK